MRLLSKRMWLVWAVGFTLVIVLNECRRSQKGNGTTHTTQTPQAEAQPSVQSASLKAVIENVSMYPVPNNRQDLAISMVVSLSNSGQPSVVKGWNLEVDSLDPSVPSGMVPVHVNGIVDLPGTTTKLDLGKEDLALNTADSTLGNNANIRGVLTFVLPKTSPSDLANNSSSFILHFKDAAGNPYQTDKALIGSKKVSSSAAR